MHIMNLCVTNSQLIAVYMSVLLAHETVHTYVFDDVYDTDCHFADTTYDCLMDYLIIDNVSSSSHQVLNRYNSATRIPSNAFCDSCLEGIQYAVDLKYFY